MEQKTDAVYKHFSRPLISILYLINWTLVITIVLSAMTIVDYTFKDLLPEGTQNTYNSFDGIAFAIASVIVATPIFFVILFFLRRAEERDLLLKNSYARKITYILAAVIFFCYIVGILISSIFALILGTISLAAGLASLTGIVILLIPLVYYLLQLRK